MFCVVVHLGYQQLTLARATCRPNLSVIDAPTLNLRFDSFLVPILAPLSSSIPVPSRDDGGNIGAPLALHTLSSKLRAKLEQIVARDSLADIDVEDKEILWMARYNFVQDSAVLP